MITGSSCPLQLLHSWRAFLIQFAVPNKHNGMPVIMFPMTEKLSEQIENDSEKKQTNCRNKLLPRLLKTHTNTSYKQQCEHKHSFSQVHVSDQSHAILDFIN